MPGDLSALEEHSRNLLDALKDDLVDVDEWEITAACTVVEIVKKDGEDMAVTTRVRYRGTPTTAIGLLEGAKHDLLHDLG